ncbi:hypothetical protein [Duganella aceris]|nr:hypothetical protein [Duganella aceris]
MQSALAVLLALLGVAGMTVVYLQLAVDTEFFFSSDALYLPTLYDNVIEQGGRLKRWYLTPAPYFFPDWPLYFGLRWLAGTTFHAMAALMAVQALALWGLAALLARRAMAWTPALAGATLATVAVCAAAAGGAFPYAYVMLGSYHFGTFLLVLAGLLMLLPLLAERPVTRGAQAGLALLVAVTVLSDRLYGLQFVLPSLGLLVLMRARVPHWRRLCAALLAGCVAGVLLYKFKLLVPNSVSMPWKLAPARLGVNLGDLLAMFDTLRAQCAPLAWYCALYYALLLTLAPGTLLNRGRWRLAGLEAAWLGMFSLCGTAGLLLVMAISSAPATTRYLIPAALLPLVLGPLLLAAQWPRRAAAHGYLPLTLAALLALWPLAGKVAASGPLRQAYYPETVACVDRVLALYSLQHGYGGYWDAGWLAMHSRQRPTVAPVKADLAPLKWITTLDNFRDNYDFALVAADAADGERPQPSLVTARSGAPQAAVTCGPLQVLAYPSGGLRLQGGAP